MVTTHLVSVIQSPNASDQNLSRTAYREPAKSSTMEAVYVV